MEFGIMEEETSPSSARPPPIWLPKKHLMTAVPAAPATFNQSAGHRLVAAPGGKHEHHDSRRNRCPHCRGA